MGTIFKNVLLEDDTGGKISALLSEFERCGARVLEKGLSEVIFRVEADLAADG